MASPIAPVVERSPSHVELVAGAHSLIPAGTTCAIVPPVGLEFVVQRGEGPHLIDVDGRVFLDFLLGGGPLVLGHAHPRIVAKLTETLPLGTHHMELTQRTIELAQRLVDNVPSAEMVRFCSSGSEATFHALRLARAVSGRQGIIKFDGAYHGHHDFAVWSYERTVTDVPTPAPESAGVQRGVSDDVVVLPFNDVAVFRRTLREQPERFAAVICEPLQRVLSPAPGFLEALREECDRTGTILIFDEVVTGFRLAAGGAQGKYGVVPDLTTLGKALSGGLPLAALVGRRDLMAHLSPHSDSETFSFHCGTFNGYLLGVESAHTTLDILLDEGGIDRLAELGELCREQLARVFADAGVDAYVAGEGPLFHAYITPDPVIDNRGVIASDWAFSDELHRQLRQAGIFKSFVKGYLSVVHDEGHLDELAGAVQWSLRQMT